MVWRAFGQGRYAVLAAADVVVAIGHSMSFQMRFAVASNATASRRGRDGVRGYRRR